MALQEVLIKPRVSLPQLRKFVQFNGIVVPCSYFIDLRDFGLPWAVAKYPISNEIYKPYLDLAAKKKLPYNDDTRFADPHFPVIGVSYVDAVGYCEWLSHLSGWQVELPTEESWELFASCNDASRQFSTQENRCDIDHANYGLNFGSTTQVDKYPSNEWGIHDMTGNVLEWTNSIPRPEQMRSEYGAMPAETPTEFAKNRVLKGGCWAFSEENCAIKAFAVLGTHFTYHTTGFRPVIFLEPV